MGASTQPSGKGNVTTPGQGGQPAFGQPSQSMTMDMPQQYGQGTLDQNAINANPQGFNQYQSQMQQREAQMPGSTMLGQQGQQNRYGNTVGGWDNATIQPQSTGTSGGKGGKGQSSWQPFNANWTPSSTQTDVTQASGTQNQINAQGNQRFGT